MHIQYYLHGHSDRVYARKFKTFEAFGFCSRPLLIDYTVYCGSFEVVVKSKLRQRKGIVGCIR